MSALFKSTIKLTNKWIFVVCKVKNAITYSGYTKFWNLSATDDPWEISFTLRLISIIVAIQKEKAGLDDATLTRMWDRHGVVSRDEVDGRLCRHRDWFSAIRICAKKSWLMEGSWTLVTASTCMMEALVFGSVIMRTTVFIFSLLLGGEALYEYFLR